MDNCKNSSRTYMGKESEKQWRCVCVCIKLNHLAVHLKLTQHGKSTVLYYKIKINKTKHGQGSEEVEAWGQQGALGWEDPAREGTQLRWHDVAGASRQFRNASEHAAATSLSLHCGLSHRSGYFVGNLSPDVAVPLPRADCFLPPSTQVNQQEPSEGSSATTSITKRPWLSSRMGFCKILPIYHLLGLNSASHR